MTDALFPIVIASVPIYSKEPGRYTKHYRYHVQRDQIMHSRYLKYGINPT